MLKRERGRLAKDCPHPLCENRWQIDTWAIRSWDGSKMNAETTTIYMCARYFSSICHNSLCHLFNYCSKFICLIELSHMSCTVETHPTEKTLLHQSLVCHPCYKVSCLMVMKVKKSVSHWQKKKKKKKKKKKNRFNLYLQLEGLGSPALLCYPKM